MLFFYNNHSTKLYPKAAAERQHKVLWIEQCPSGYFEDHLLVNRKACWPSSKRIIDSKFLRYQLIVSAGRRVHPFKVKEEKIFK